MGDRFRHPVAVTRRRRFVRDSSLDSSKSFRRTPRHFAPAPPQQTVINDAKRGQQRFTLIRKIGEGSQGRCDLLENKANGRLIVYKLMKDEVIKMRVSGKDKPREVAILKDILGSHPRIIALYHWTSVPKETVFYSEYCSLGDLSGFIKGYHNKLGLDVPEAFIWHTYIQLAEALTFLAEGYDRSRTEGEAMRWKSPRRNHAPIVHRDIKPHNIFLRTPKSMRHYPDIVLADFGLATTRTRSCDGDSAEKSGCGTYGYQGPEIPLHSLAGDVWAVGACLHHMAVGAAPISRCPRGRDEKTWYMQPEARKRSDLRKHGYSTGLDNTLYKAMRTYPRDRLIGRDLVDAVERGMENYYGEVEMLVPWLD